MVNMPASLQPDPAPNPDAPPSPIVYADIARAAARLAGAANRTPTLRSRTIASHLGLREVFFKCENLQRIGAFKFRGAYNAIVSLKDRDAPERTAGVLAYSSGNHAQAIALAGAMLGVPTVIVMPSNAPRIKLDATRGYVARGAPGSEVVLYDPNHTRREELGARIAAERNLVLIPPYDHPDVIAGQGTCAVELIREAGPEPIDALFVCVGGGGLLSGCAIAARHLAPHCKVIGIEPAAADDAARSFRTRTLQIVHNPITIADGARTPSLGRWTFPLVLANVDAIETVSEDEIRSAMRICIERLKLVVEPTGAIALAGLIRAATRPNGPSIKGGRIGVIISGGNVDLAEISPLIAGASDPFVECRQEI